MMTFSLPSKQGIWRRYQQHILRRYTSTLIIIFLLIGALSPPAPLNRVPAEHIFNISVDGTTRAVYCSYNLYDPIKTIVIRQHCTAAVLMQQHCTVRGRAVLVL